MTPDGYIRRIDELIEKLKSDTSYDASEELQFLYEMKPVRLGWYLADAMNYFNQTKDVHGSIAKLAAKYVLGTPYQHIEECCAFIKSLYEYISYSEDAKRLECDRRFVAADYEGFGEYYSVIEQLCEKILCSSDQMAEEMEKQLNEELVSQLYIVLDKVALMLYTETRRLSGLVPGGEHYDEWVWNGDNLGYIKEILQNASEHCFVFVEQEHNACLIELLAKMLAKISPKVICIRKALECPGDGIRIEDTIAISIENIEICGNQVYVTPVRLLYTDGSNTDNIVYLLEYVNRHYNNSGLLHVISNGYTIDELTTRPQICKKMSRINTYGYDRTEMNLCFAWFGDYRDYISTIYCMDCKALTERPAEKKFSIVIPARNSSVTLRHTIKTCLQQTYKGDYEILISDNSTGQNMSVYELCKELADDRIRYVRTPRNLHLPKSFEYAYLQAKGEYVFALGSDDGLLPWALEVLEQVSRQYPDEEVLQWERGFYAWPGFNGGQEHQFVIPRKYEKGNYRTFYMPAETYLSTIIEKPTYIYMLPMLYINSCFKRSYLLTLLRYTGRLWDGPCQDIYMGIMTACIKPQILNMMYPLTIAGMSSGSLGAAANLPQKTQQEVDAAFSQLKADGNMGLYVQSYYEHKSPLYSMDMGLIYSVLLRAVSLGVISMEYLESITDWKTVFKKMLERLSISDVLYDNKVQAMAEAAENHGEEFKQWFARELYPKAMQPKKIRTTVEASAEVPGTQKTYRNEVDSVGGITWDASEYGVENIYDAVQLFAKLSELL